MFGTLPAYGFYVRHARNVSLRDVQVGFEAEDLRPPFVLDDVSEVHFDHVTAQTAPGVSFALLRDVRGLSSRASPGLTRARREGVEAQEPSP